MNRGGGAIRPRYAEVNVEQARGVIREMDIEQAERGERHYQAGLTRVKAEIAAMPPLSPLLANLSAHQTNLECLRDECRQRIAELQTSETNQKAGNGGDESNRFLTPAQRKLNDPLKFPTMNAKEVMAVLGLKSSTVYDHPRLKRASTGTRHVVFTTKSVKAVIDSPPE